MTLIVLVLERVLQPWEAKVSYGEQVGSQSSEPSTAA